MLWYFQVLLMEVKWSKIKILIEKVSVFKYYLHILMLVNFRKACCTLSLRWDEAWHRVAKVRFVNLICTLVTHAVGEKITKIVMFTYSIISHVPARIQYILIRRSLRKCSTSLTLSVNQSCWHTCGINSL